MCSLSVAVPNARHSNTRHPDPVHWSCDSVHTLSFVICGGGITLVNAVNREHSKMHRVLPTA